MFFHQHPYPIFIPEGAGKIIVGTLPPPRFSFGELRGKDVNFCYGSCDGLLWPVLDAIFSLNLRYDNSEEAVSQRQAFLRREKIGICDIVESCLRDQINASDLGMRDIQLRDIIAQLDLHPTLHTLVFTGGNSKNGPEYLFRKLLQSHGLQLHCISNETPRGNRFFYACREITTISLTSPSNAANMAIGSSSLYKLRKKDNPAFTTFDFRVEQYKKVFIC
ncbi:MAG: uracil-DNA glycosylase family protein [Proteobacteria bacterium]|nr:uracil-DNA glycosylase family protein [Pseudomonadota bacterium]